MYHYFGANEVRPGGWLLQQLKIQAEGLSGNLDKIWPDVRDSAWIGGHKDGWERVPYWLDGFIPLAHLLEDEDMKARADRYINATGSRRTAGSVPVRRRSGENMTSGHFSSSEKCSPFTVSLRGANVPGTVCTVR